MKSVSRDRVGMLAFYEVAAREVGRSVASVSVGLSVGRYVRALSIKVKTQLLLTDLHSGHHRSRPPIHPTTLHYAYAPGVEARG